jgi:cytidyltransferase-like protein
MQKIVWLTGHSGSGKTTIAKSLQTEWPCIILDGNEMRPSISEGAGFSEDDRAEHNYRVARLAKTLAKQMNVVVSVIAPIKEVRDNIQGVQWIWVKRNIQPKEGHFYEVSKDYPILDCDNWTIEECVTRIKAIIGIPRKKTYSLFPGRWQPLHKGHLALFEKVRKEGKSIAIGIRDTEIDKDNPLTPGQRLVMIKRAAPDALVFIMPDISEVCYGRDVGWGIREIRFDEKTEAVSASKIRNAAL